MSSGTMDTYYTVANLVDLNPAKPCKLTTQTGAFLWDFGSAKGIDLVAIIHHNLDAGLAVYIQGNATDSWGSPTLSQAITIPVWWQNGMPVNALVDLSALANHAFQFWRLLISGTNSVPIAIGDVMLVQTKRNLTINIEWGFTEQEDHPLIEHTTDYMVPTVYSYGVSKRSLSGSLNTTDAGAVELRSWYRSCSGRAQPFLFELDGGVTNDCWLARFANTSLSITHVFEDINTTVLAFEEVARGLPL